jgi:hypothetical protein
VNAVIHVAGVHIQIGKYLRQRCGWCGAVLLDYDLSRIAVPVGEDPTPATWPMGSLVSVDGNLSVLVDHEDGTNLPEGACGRIDPEVTR